MMTLPKELEALVDQHLATGRFQSAEDVLATALLSLTPATEQTAMGGLPAVFDAMDTAWEAQDAVEDFWAQPTVAQLTHAHGLDPAFDLRTLTDGWPEGDDVDGFLAAIDADQAS